MKGRIGRFARAWTWFWAPEDLAPNPADDSTPPSPATDRHATTLRSVFFTMDELPSEPVPRNRGRSFLGWLTAAEDLDAPPPQQSPRNRDRSFLGWLAATEDLGAPVPKPSPRTDPLED